MSRLEFRKFRAFNAMVADDAARDLTLLNQIESTLNLIDVELLRVEQSNKSAQLLIEMANKTKDVIDSSGKLVMEFEKTRDTIAEKHRDLVIARQSASDDSRLNERDGIIEGYDSLIKALAELHNNLNALAWTVGENDADHDTLAEKSYSNIEAMFADMGV